MTDTIHITADDISDEVSEVMGILNRSLDGHSIDAILLGCAGFLRVIIDNEVDHSEKAEALEMVATELLQDDEEVP